MKVILTHEVTGLGTAGDVVEVKDGYARNFLLRRGLATGWTKGVAKQVAAIQKGREVREIKSLDEAKGMKGQLEAKSVKVVVKAGKAGRLFGAVTPAIIADAIGQRAKVDKRRIHVSQPIKALGEYQIQVGLHDNVSATVTLQVVDEAK